MNIITLFEAFEKALEEKETALERRKDRFGIMVGGDRYARRYQRYDRLARRISGRVHGVKMCPNCNCPHGDHYSSCRRNSQ